MRVSACAHPLADVKWLSYPWSCRRTAILLSSLRIDRVPYWWAVLPPDPRVLRGAAGGRHCATCRVASCCQVSSGAATGMQRDGFPPSHRTLDDGFKQKRTVSVAGLA